MNSLEYDPHTFLGHGGRYGGRALPSSVRQHFSKTNPYSYRDLHGEEGGAGEAVQGSGSVACYQQSVFKVS